MKPVFVVSAIVLASATAGHAQNIPMPEQYSVRVDIRGWHPNLTATMQMSEGSVTGTLIDVPRDLGVGNKDTLEFRGAFQLGVGHKIRGSYTKLDYDGDKNITKEIRFEDTIYPRFTRVITSTKGAYYTAEYQWDLIKGEHGYLAALGGIKMFDVDNVLVAPDRGDREQETFRVPVPVIGGSARGYYGKFSGTFELTGFTIGGRGNLLEMDMGARFHLGEHLSLGIGYRLLKLHGKDGKDLINLRFNGAYLGAELGI